MGEYRFDPIVDILLPRGGWVIIWEAYSDASLTRQSPNIPEADRFITVATFMFEASASRLVNEKWEAILEPVLKGLPPNKRFFHMTDLFEKRRPYTNFNEADKLGLQRQLIDSLQQHVEFGAVASVRLSEYEAVVNELPEGISKEMGSAYAFLNLWCMDALAGHLRANKKEGDIAFIFEDGDSDKNDLDIRMAKIEASRYLKRRFRYYRGRTYMPKTGHHALAAADMLAWEYRNGIEKHFKWHEPQRLMMYAMFDEPVHAQYFSETSIKFRSMAEMIERAKMWASERDGDVGSLDCEAD
jgi:hypothetical protein